MWVLSLMRFELCNFCLCATPSCQVGKYSVQVSDLGGDKWDYFAGTMLSWKMFYFLLLLFSLFYYFILQL